MSRTLVIAHDLGTGIGQADFALDALRFGAAIQPDDLTPMALGVVANVEGAAEGSGTIRWSPEGVTSSTGTFATQAMNFAAAFGPVTGFATTIRFTDLLAMKTAPHQRMTMKQVSAGVDVYDGVVDYALLSNEQARIEGGRWPSLRRHARTAARDAQSRFPPAAPARFSRHRHRRRRLHPDDGARQHLGDRHVRWPVPR